VKIAQQDWRRPRDAEFAASSGDQQDPPQPASSGESQYSRAFLSAVMRESLQGFERVEKRLSPRCLRAVW